MGKKRLRLDSYIDKFQQRHDENMNPVLDLCMCWHDVDASNSCSLGDRVSPYDNTRNALMHMHNIFYVQEKTVKKLDFVNFGALDVNILPSFGICVGTFRHFAVYDCESQCVYIWSRVPKGHMPKLIGYYNIATHESTVCTVIGKRLVEDYAYLTLNIGLAYLAEMPTVKHSEDWMPYGKVYKKRFRKFYYNPTDLGFNYITFSRRDHYRLRKGDVWMS